MSSPVARRAWFLALLAILLLVACSRPKPPTLTPQRVETIGTSANGLIFRVQCKAHNPNGYPLPTRKASGTITLGASSLGTVEAAALPTLPANSDTDVAFDLVVPWSSLGTALAAAIGSEEIPYIVEGRVEFEAAGVSISAPFTIKSKVRKAELAVAFLRFLPANLRPRLPLPSSP